MKTMSKVITFSRVFPSYHPKAGQPTFFVEKIFASLPIKNHERYTLHDLYAEHINPSEEEFLKGSCNPVMDHKPKHHTIRAGHRFKVGDWFSPRVWSGKSYNSKQIQFAPDIQVKKTWDVELDDDGCFWIISDKERGPGVLNRLARNDGLTKGEMMDWFNKPFTGQIICWSDSIDY